MNAPIGRRGLFAGLALLALLAGLLAWQWPPLYSWYAVRQLAAAEGKARQTWVQRVAALDETAVPRLRAVLRIENPTACANVEAALATLARNWGAEDARAQRLAEALRDDFGRMSFSGQVSALHALTALLEQKGPPLLPAPLTRPAGDVLRDAAANDALRCPALGLAAALLERVPVGQWLDPCRGLAMRGLAETKPAVRVAAINVVLRPALRQDRELLVKLVPLLRDPDAGVRRAALVALAPARELAGEDMLIPLLHDADPQVQDVCETALRSRGLSETHILMAKLLTDPSPTARLRVLHYLGRERDLDPTVWLRRLTQDAAPAVRAAAVRAAARHPRVDLAERLRAMAREDPSETVRLNARHYLSRTAP